MISVEVVDDLNDAPTVPRNNNFINKKSKNTSNQLIISQVLCGLNRIYLINNSKLVTWMNYAYSSAVVFYYLFMTYYCLDKSWKLGPKIVFVLLFFANILRIVISILMTKRKFVKLIRSLCSFDELLGIRQQETDKQKYSWLWLVACLSLELYSVHTLIELGNLPNDTFIAVANVMTGLSVEIEIFFYVSLICLINVRISILKAHVVKMYKRDDIENLTREERLCYNTDLDIDSLHSVYNLIYKCSQLLNSAINVPMAVALCELALFTVLNTSDMYRLTYEMYLSYITITIFISVAAICLSFITLYGGVLFCLCYYSTVTSKHTATIRHILNETLNTKQMGYRERHKLKSLYRVTLESDIKYTAAGVLRIHMSLIPSYYYICLVYTIIFMQFSKFMWDKGIFPSQTTQ